MEPRTLISFVFHRVPRPWCAALLLASCVFGVACDRNTSPYVGEEEPRQPDLSRIFPEAQAPHDHAPDAGAGAAAREDIAQETDRVGSARGPAIAGEVRLGGSAAPDGAMLFVIARAQGARGGPPLAVLRVPNPGFPFAFELSQANVMIPSMRFDGEMDVTARLDIDGNAMTRDAGDLEGRADGSHVPGDAGVVIVLEPAGS